MRMQQKNTFVSSCEGHMVCPKPRRVSVFNTAVNEPVRPLTWHMCYQPESRLELLEFIFENPPASPFLTGSPPTRVSNPLTQDTRFSHNKVSLTSERPPASREKKVDPDNGNFGNKPVARIEGFDCISTLV